MPKKIFSISAILIAVILVAATFTQGTIARGRPYRAIVILDEHANNQPAVQALENMGGRVLKELGLVNGMVVFLPEQASANILVDVEGVVRVEEDIRVFAHKPPNSCDPWPDCKNTDPEPSPSPEPSPTPGQEQIDWGVDRIDADLTWATATGDGVKVAIIDTGIDQNHPGLVANLAGGVNFVAAQGGPPWQRIADPADWDDDNGHGTHVAGTVAEVDDITGYIGVANTASLYGVKVLDKNGSGYLSDVISGIEWSINNNIDVINMSLGSSSGTQSMQDAVDAAYASGIVVVASAGNSGDGNSATNEVSYPAKYSSVMAVAATASDDTSPYWSSEGSEVEIAAPGVSITSTWNDGGYNTISGTSMASPHVAGVAALVLSHNPGLTPAQVRTTLRDTADDLGDPGVDNHFGYGLVDAEQAVTGVETN